MNVLGNRNLTAAKAAKNDEFYTQLSDVERELAYYKPHFKGKVVYCNCDDPLASAFCQYFSANFEHLGLKRLVTTCYWSRDKYAFSRNDSERGLKLIYEGDLDGNRRADDWEFEGVGLFEDGDFRSLESVELLKQADIVVTNPPFSLFREYVAQLMEYGKKFLIVGNKNAITYKEVFPLIRDGKMWIGHTPMGKDMLFGVPEGVAEEMVAAGGQGSRWRGVDGKVMARAQACWFTNLDTPKRHEKLILDQNHYTPEDYPKYDNYDAIEVSRTRDIPGDYDGVMGVPITFLDKYNPDQFEIVGSNRGRDQDPTGYYGRGSFLDGRETFKRLFIRSLK